VSSVEGTGFPSNPEPVYDRFRKVVKTATIDMPIACEDITRFPESSDRDIDEICEDKVQYYLESNPKIFQVLATDEVVDLSR
jgi:hypothetical protein